MLRVLVSMMKRELVIGLVAVGILVVAGLAVLRSGGDSPSSPAPAVKAEAPPAPVIAAAPPVAPATPLPSFDVVRVNPQGGAVMAGRAAPGAEVTVLDGDQPVGRVTADRNGEWVLVPDAPLPPGSHQLGLAARLPGGGATATSEGIVAMLVPEPAAPGAGSTTGAVAVLVPRDSAGGAARALQVPPEGAPRKLTVDAIAYDAAGNAQLVGRAEPGDKVQVFLEDHLVGNSVADRTGAWSVMLAGEVPVGHYHLRVEAANGDGGVTARLALNFDRAATAAGFASVEVQRGNSLWRIAQRSYGDGFRYAEIFQANRPQIRDPDLIYPGQVFVVPKAR
jgi:nucleoid-associated protein YgaU